MKKFWTRRKIPPIGIANAYRFSAPRCTASQGLVAVDNHKFHSSEQYSSIYSIGRNISKPTIKIFYCTRTRSLRQWLPPLLASSKADNRWHNKCNKSTQSVYLLALLARNRRCAKMISVFDEASPEPNIEFMKKCARRRPFHRLHTKYRLVNRDLRSKIHKSLTAATSPSALRFLFPFMSPGRARRRG